MHNSIINQKCSFFAAQLSFTILQNFSIRFRKSWAMCQAFTMTSQVLRQSSERMMVLRRMGSEILAQTMVRSTMSIMWKMGLSVVMSWQTDLKPRNLSFFLTCLAWPFSTNSMDTAEKWQLIELDWNISRSVFSMPSSSPVTYFTDNCPFTGRYSTRNQFFGSVCFFMFVKGLYSSQFVKFKDSWAIVQKVLWLNSRRGFQWSENLQEYFLSSRVQPSTTPTTYSCCEVVSAAPCSVTDCSMERMWALMSTRMVSSMALSMSLWRSSGLHLLRALRQSAQFLQISGRRYLILVTLMAEKSELFIDFTSTEYSLKISLSSRDRMAIRGLLSFFPFSTLHMFSKAANCLQTALSAGSFSLVSWFLASLASGATRSRTQ